MVTPAYLVDTHCHVHETSYPLSYADIQRNCGQEHVGQLICVGTDAEDSQTASDFATLHPGVWVAVGIHPHNASTGEDDLELISRLCVEAKTVAIGECGLDYYYNHSPMDAQHSVLKAQLMLASAFQKPCIFHVREAFDDFWSLYDACPTPGVVHSFTGTVQEMQEAVSRGLYIGLNGIMTFSKDPEHKRVAYEVPLEKLVLETDAPFLTPVPKRGTVNEPAYVRLVAAYLAELRGISLDKLIEATTKNAQTLFSLTSDTLY
jgi:TatD DNase family protein